MAYHFPLLLYAGLGGGLLLLLLGSLPGLRRYQLPVTAAWMTVLSVLWMLLPAQGRWVLSVWTPRTVLEGWLIVDMTPFLWSCGLALALAMSGALWVNVGARRADLPLTGALLVTFVAVTWTVIGSGTLLMTLATWAVFDLLWLVSRLLAGDDGSRVIWAAAVHGGSSLLLWGVSLLMLERGESGLWWLMQPSQPVLILMVAAGVVRLGFYPFQIVFPENVSVSRTQALIGLMGPISGVSLLARLLELPGVGHLPTFFVVWGAVSVLWLGIRALTAEEDRQGERWAIRAVFLTVVTGALAVHSSPWLVGGTAAWLLAAALLISARRWHGAQPFWSLPRVFAVVLFVGVPTSAFGQLYSLSLVSALGSQLLIAVGLALANGSFLAVLNQHAEARVDEPWPLLRIARALGLAVLAGSLMALTPLVAQVSFSWSAFVLWLFALLVGVSLAVWRDGLRPLVKRWSPVLNFLDLGWAYRSVWQGSENLLGLLRVAADVVEGSGSILWSVLILLLVLMIAGSQ